MQFNESKVEVKSDNVIVDLVMQLSAGNYNEKLQFQLETPASYRGPYPMNGKTIAETNEEIRNGLMLSMQYSFEEIGILQDGGTVAAPTPIPDEVQNQLNALLPAGQTTAYTEEQLNNAYKIVQEFIMTPPIVQQYSLEQSPAQSREQIAINLENTGNIKEMRAQAILAATLAAEGANVSVRVTPPDDNARDIFVRDPVAIVGDTVLIPTSFKREQTELIAQLQAAGYTKFLNVDAEFCGGAVTTINVDGKLKIMIAPMNGQSAESFAQAVEALKNSTGMDVIEIPVPENVRGTFFHLDTFLSVLPNGEVMVYPGATTPETIDMLRNTLGEDRIIAISQEDALKYATNIAAVGNTLVTVGMSPELEGSLEEKGYKVITSEEAGLRPGEFLMRQGGPHCLTQYPDPASINAVYSQAQYIEMQPYALAQPEFSSEQYNVMVNQEFAHLNIPDDIFAGLGNILAATDCVAGQCYAPSTAPNMLASATGVQLS